MDPLRIACIGPWGHLDSVLQELDTLNDPAVQVVALANALPPGSDEDFTDYRKFKSARSAPHFPDYRKMLKEIRPHVAVISTRLDQIAPIAIDAANAGCHLLCEKPLALTHASLENLAQAIRKNNVLCIAMIGNRTHPVLAAARQLVQSGRIGNVILANARKSYKWGGGGARPDWFGNRQLYGGTIGWIGIHGLDFILTATGQEFSSVAAMQSNLAHPERPQCEDNAVLILQLNNGGHATLTMDFLRPNAAATHGNDFIRVVGSQGVIEADMAFNRLVVTTNDHPEEQIPLAPPAPFYADFYNHLRRGDQSPPPDMHKAFYLTHTALCARDAADETRIVPIPPFEISNPKSQI